MHFALNHERLPDLTTHQVQIGRWKPLPEGGSDAQVFAIGDIHGQADALESVLAAIAAIPRRAKVRRLIFLGDLIDRGPHSLRAIALATDASCSARVDDVILLPGNHELMLLDGLDLPEHYLADWLDNGGEDLILEAEPGCTAKKLKDLADAARRAIDLKFLVAMRNGPTWHRENNLVFVHAGLNPNADAHEFLNRPRLFSLSSDHWAWIREPFLDWTSGWGPDQSWLIIHGHTPAICQPVDLQTFEREADNLATHRRLCLDAGAAVGLPQLAFLEIVGGKYRVGLVAA